MDEATTRFASNGYHTTSVAEIVQGVGVGKGVFYWYFESKDALLLAILKEAQKDLRRTQQQAITDVDDPVERIELGIRASIDWYAEHHAVNEVTQFARTEERFASALRKGTEVAVDDTVRLLRAAADQGLIRDADLVVQAHAILGATVHVARRFLSDESRPTGEIADDIVSFCLGGLGATPAATRTSGRAVARPVRPAAISPRVG